MGIELGFMLLFGAVAVALLVSRRRDTAACRRTFDDRDEARAYIDAELGAGREVFVTVLPDGCREVRSYVSRTGGAREQQEAKFARRTGIDRD